MKTLKRLNKAERTISLLLARFYGNLKYTFYKDTYKRSDPDSFHCIPFTDSVFLAEVLMRIHKTYKLNTDKQPSFLDVGCGIGHIVALADVIGFKAEGLEFIIPENRASIPIKQGDALKFKNYKDYNVIYCYQIFKNRDKLKQLYDLIVKKAAPGTFIFPVGSYQHSSFKDTCERIELPYGSYVYIKN